MSNNNKSRQKQGSSNRFRSKDSKESSVNYYALIEGHRRRSSSLRPLDDNSRS